MVDTIWDGKGAAPSRPALGEALPTLEGRWRGKAQGFGLARGSLPHEDLWRDACALGWAARHGDDDRVEPFLGAATKRTAQAAASLWVAALRGIFFVGARLRALQARPPRAFANLHPRGGQRAKSPRGARPQTHPHFEEALCKKSTLMPPP